MRRNYLQKALLISVAIAILIISSSGLAAIFKTSRQQSGFSTDSRHYIYLETTRDPVNDVPEAFLQIINISSNNCVRNGCIETEYSTDSPRVTTTEAGNSLLRRTLPLRQSLRLTRLRTGIRLAPRSRKTNSDGSETYVFRLNNQQNIELRMAQRYIPSIVYGGSADIDRASLGLEVTYNYRKRTLSYIDNYREEVLKYSLREVFLSPNRQNVVIVFNVIKPATQGAMQGTFLQSFSL